ncbi:Transcriptional regulator lytR [Corynebacterium renale]|nr:Transcriptional regulator lytR [Corynebacterium renale]STC94474.1 Transcriptional regulator lytR [Corynebacterium renale]
MKENRSARTVREFQPAPDMPTRIEQAGSGISKTLIAVMSVLVLVVGGLGYFSVGRLGNEVASASNLSLGGGQGVKDAKDGATDILLVGSDSRRDAQGNPLSEQELAALNAGVEDGEYNTDTIMVIRVPNDGSSATAVSIPRDTYVNEGDFGNMKINGVFSTHMNNEREELMNAGVTDEDTLVRRSTEAGRKGLIDAVSRLTGVEVDHYAEIGLVGFVLLTDALGGVDVCLNNDVYDEFSGANFHAGVQTLNGHEALAFVRQRHGLPRGDLDRVVRQQAFMASMVNKVLSAGTLTSPSKLSDLSTAAERSVIIDEGWDIVSFATQLAGLAGGNVTFSTIPVTSVDGVGDYGESIVTVDVDQVHAFMDDLLGEEESAEETPTQEAPAGGVAVTDKEIHVLNAGGPQGLAAGVGSYLANAGNAVVETANAMPGLYSASQVLAPSESDPDALALAEALGGLPVVANASLDANTLIVVTANDYTGPRDENAEDIQPDPEDAVGQPGADFGAAEVAPTIDAGGNGPRCVN